MSGSKKASAADHTLRDTSAARPQTALSRLFGSVELQAGLLAPAMALLLAMAAGHLLILAYGASPRQVFGVLLEGTWGNAYGIGQVLFKATPLILTGLAVALPFRAGLFNIGAEGQVVLGALATAVLGWALPAATPALIAVPLCAVAGFTAGALWGGLPGALKARFGAHEVISTIMLNFVALALVNYLVARHLHVPETLHTPAIIEAARMTRLSVWFSALHGSAVSTALLAALAAAGGCWWFLFHTPLGYELRVQGHSAPAARAAGISSLRASVLALALGGGLAGLVGMGAVQGHKYYFEEGFSGGIGFMGIAVALLGRNHPVGVVLAALLFGTLSQGGLVINPLVPKEIVEILQGVIILCVVAATPEVRAVLRRQGGRT